MDEQLTQPNIAELTAKIDKTLEDNPLLWGGFFCEHHFRSVSPIFHLTVMKASMTEQRLAIAAPRGSAKSTIMSFLKSLHSVAYKKRRFIVIVQNTYAKACGSLEAVKKEIKENTKIIEHYGINITKDAEGDSIFRHPDGFEIRVLCKGAEQIGSVRGEKFGAYRPDLIIGDDIEDDELVESPERRGKLHNLIDDALIPAGDTSTQYIFIFTILHDDSQGAKFLSKEYYPEYKKLLFRALYRNSNGELTSLWKEKWSVDDLLWLRNNKPSSFAKEYQNDPVSGLMRKFNKQDFRYWRRDGDNCVLLGVDNDIIAQYKLSECIGAVACDLAWETKRESDFSVILPAFLTPASDLLVDDYICKKGMRPHEIEEILFGLDTRMRSTTGSSVYFGFEKAKLEKVIKFLLRGAMSKRNHYLLFKDLVWDTDKVQRVITRLEPRYAQHSIYHKHGMGELERQLTRFPSGTHDDLPDALQGVVQLLRYPKSAKKQKPEDNQFMKLRKFAIDSKKPDRNKFNFGNKGKFWGLPSKRSVL